MKSFVLNLLVALVWLLLKAEPSTLVFATGWVAGFVLIALFQPILGSRDYVRRTLAVARYAFVFGRAFVASCWQLLDISLLRPAGSIEPRLITYDVRGLTDLELLLLSHSISLTPGTTTVDIAADRSHLLLHVLDAPDPEAVRTDIDRTLRRGILAFTR
jgi:multicomponent Na+:H+ antiporter subunit E